MRRALLLLILCQTPLLAQGLSRDLQHGAGLLSLVFHPAGQTLLSGGEDQTIRVWDLGTGKESRQLREHEGSVASLALTRDGSRLASGGRDGSLLLWDYASGRLLHRLAGHERSVLAVAFSPDGRQLASVSYDQTLRLWDVKSGKELARIEAHRDAVSCVSFSPDGRTIATGGHDSFVRLWTIGVDGKGLKPSHVLRDHNRGEVTGVAFCLSGKLLASVTPQGTIRLRDPGKGEQLRHSSISDTTILKLTCSADGRTLAGAGLGGNLGLIEVGTGQPIVTREEPAARTSDLDFSPLGGYVGQVRAIALSPTGLLVAAGTKEGVILVRDVARILQGRTVPTRLTEMELQAIWSDLRGGEALAGYRGIARLVARPEASIPFLRKHLPPTSRPDREQIDRLIEQLDHPRYRVREKAAGELERMLEQAEGQLRERLARSPALEARRRIERLLAPLDDRVFPPDRLRAARALTALEHIGSAEARELLQRLAGGSPGAWLTLEAEAALTRLNR